MAQRKRSVSGTKAERFFKDKDSETSEVHKKVNSDK